MPGQCLTIDAMPAPSCAAMMTSVKDATVVGSSPKLRDPRSEPDPTSTTGPKFMLNPSSDIDVA